MAHELTLTFMGACLALLVFLLPTSRAHAWLLGLNLFFLTKWFMLVVIFFFWGLMVASVAAPILVWQRMSNEKVRTDPDFSFWKELGSYLMEYILPPMDEAASYLPSSDDLLDKAEWALDHLRRDSYGLIGENDDD